MGDEMNDQIKELAVQAGLQNTLGCFWQSSDNAIERFAELVRQDEANAQTEYFERRFYLQKDSNEGLVEALREIANETYDEWTNGARAQRIAEAALAKHKEQE